MVLATANDGSGSVGSIHITISTQDIAVTSILLSGEGGSAEIAQPGGTLQMVATIIPSNATNKSVSWSVINSNGMATISTDGLLQAVSDGIVFVVASANDGSGVQNAFQVLLSNQKVLISSIAVSGEGGQDTIYEYGGQLQMLAHILPENASNKDIHWAVTQISGKADIDQKGLLSAISDGLIQVVALADDEGMAEGSTLIYITGQSTSTLEAKTSPDVQILPDPNLNMLHLRFMNTFDTGAIIRIYNIHGQLVYTKTVQSDMLQVDMSLMERGYYIVQVNFHKSKTISKMILMY
jgi:hypothetical protein